MLQKRDPARLLSPRLPRWLTPHSPRALPGLSGRAGAGCALGAAARDRQRGRAWAVPRGRHRADGQRRLRRVQVRVPRDDPRYDQAGRRAQGLIGCSHILLAVCCLAMRPSATPALYLVLRLAFPRMSSLEMIFKRKDPCQVVASSVNHMQSVSVPGSLCEDIDTRDVEWEWERRGLYKKRTSHVFSCANNPEGEQTTKENEDERILFRKNTELFTGIMTGIPARVYHIAISRTVRDFVLETADSAQPASF